MCFGKSVMHVKHHNEPIIGWKCQNGKYNSGTVKRIHPWIPKLEDLNDGLWHKAAVRFVDDQGTAAFKISSYPHAITNKLSLYLRDENVVLSSHGEVLATGWHAFLDVACARDVAEDRIWVMTFPIYEVELRGIVQYIEPSQPGPYELHSEVMASEMRLTGHRITG